MRKGIVILVLLLFALCSCEKVESQEPLIFKYNSQEYISCYDMGDKGDWWSFVSDDIKREEISVSISDSYNEPAEKIVGDDEDNIILLGDFFCFKKGFNPPNIDENIDIIESIDLEFSDNIIRISKPDKIKEFLEIHKLATEKVDCEKDSDWDYIGNVEVYFKGFPLKRFIGRIIANEESIYYSSETNPYYIGEKESPRSKKWYSVQINSVFESSASIKK